MQGKATNKPARASTRAIAVAALTTLLCAACASAPRNGQLSSEQWRARAPLRVDFSVHRPAGLLPYEPMGRSATLDGLSAGNGAVLVLLTLPVWVAIDVGRYGAEQARKQRAARGNERFDARLDGRWPEIVQEERLLAAFREGVAQALPDVALADDGARESTVDSGIGGVLAANMRFALSSDGRALLVHVGVALTEPGAVPVQKCQGFRQCLDRRARVHQAPFRTELFFHSTPLPEAVTPARPQPVARSRPVCLFDPSRHARRAASAGTERPSIGRPSVDTYAGLWLANDAQRLREAFAEAADAISRLTRLALANDARAGRQAMDPARLLFPYFFDDELEFDVVAVENGRRVLRSRAEPTRGFGTDPLAGHWLDVPDAPGKEESFGKALLTMGPALKTVYE